MILNPKYQLYPLLIGLGLSKRDESLLHYYFGSKINVLEYDTSYFLSNYLEKSKTRICYLPFANLAELQEFSRISLGEMLNIPIFIISRLSEKLKASQIYDFLIKEGFLALWLLADYGEPVSFPRLAALAIPMTQRPSVLIVTEDPTRLKLFRQVYSFMGFDVRTDFSSLQDISFILESQSPLSILQIDLDHSSINPTELAYLLERHFSKQRLRNLKHSEDLKQEEVQVILIKDFRIPSIPLSNLGELFSNHVSRIFSWQELILSITANFFDNQKEVSANNNANNDSSNNSAKIKKLKKIISTPDINFTNLELESKTSTSGDSPFLWLQQILLPKLEKGLLLRTSPTKHFDYSTKASNY